MSETGAALAITEKKPQKPGGCVGIFFQLFDWNRRFAKKRFFPKKLLPLDCAKPASKKFGADDKLPKLGLISDENGKGFSNGKKNVDLDNKHVMRPPSLVARLMGLDSLPAVQRDKSKKIWADRGDKFASDHCPFVKQQDAKLENEGCKHDSRPQKLQRTGSSERRAVTRFGAEALQLKNVVLLRSSKHHHPTFAPPVKSPKSLSRRHASRLIGAATRILEPGLQARNRSKCALPYSSQKHHHPIDSVSVVPPTTSSQEQVQSSKYYVNTAKLSRGHSSCGNCGNIVDIVETRSYLEEQPSVLNSVDHSSFALESGRKSPVTSIELEKERTLRRIPETFAAFASQSSSDVDPQAEHDVSRITLQKGGQTWWQGTNQQYKNKQVSPSSNCYKHKLPIQNQVMLGKDRNPPRSTYSINLNKDVPLNQSPSGQASLRMPPKVDRCRYVSERRLGDRLYDPVSSARKRRSIDITRQDDISGFVGSTFDKQKNVNCNDVGETMVGLDFESKSCMAYSLSRLGEANKSRTASNIGAVSSCSPLLIQKDGIHAPRNCRRYQNECACSINLRKSSGIDRNNRNGQLCFQKSFSCKEDTLGVVLEQKLKELNSQEHNELAQGGSPWKRTSGVILQELISALATERSFDVNDMVVRPNEMGDPSYYECPSGVQAPSKAKQKRTGVQVGYSKDNSSINNLSPLSVLETSFLTESCLSSSVDDGSVHKLQTDFMDRSYNESQVGAGADLLNSATSLSKGIPGLGLVADFVNTMSDIICSMDLVDSRLNGSKLAHAEEVILSAELVFRNTFQHTSDETKGFSIFHFILNELESLASVLWTNFGRFSASEDTEGNLLKGFLFDCVIEHLDSKYGSCIISWRQLPLSMNTEMLIREVVEEIRKWTSLASFGLEELTEMEMRKWTDFEVEAYENGAAVVGDILQLLVDEIVVELCESKPAVIIS